MTWMMVMMVAMILVAAPTTKRRRLAREDILYRSLASGLYPV